MDRNRGSTVILLHRFGFKQGGMHNLTYDKGRCQTDPSSWIMDVVINVVHLTDFISHISFLQSNK